MDNVNLILLVVQLLIGLVYITWIGIDYRRFLKKQQKPEMVINQSYNVPPNVPPIVVGKEREIKVVHIVRSLPDPADLFTTEEGEVFVGRDILIDLDGYELESWTDAFVDVANNKHFLVHIVTDRHDGVLYKWKLDEHTKH